VVGKYGICGRNFLEVLGGVGEMQEMASSAS